MPAPAPVNVAVTLNPTTPKQKPGAAARDEAPGASGARSFDDALKQARAKPARAEKPAQARGAAKAQRPSKSKSSKRAEEPVDAQPSTEADPVEAALPSPEGAPAAEVEKDADPPAPASEPAATEIEPANLAAVAVAVVPAAPVDVTAEQSTVQEGAASSTPTEPAQAAAVRATSRSMPLETEPTAPGGPDALAAAGADGEAGAAPDETVRADVDRQPPELDAEGAPDQPQNIEPPALAKPVTNQQHPEKHHEQQHQHEQADPPLLAVESTAEAPLGVQPSDAEQQDVPVEATPGGAAGEPPVAHHPANAGASTSAPADALSATAVAPKSAPHAEGAPAPTVAAPPTPTPREVEFARANHDRIVTDIRAQLLPKGGAMQIRLDPPQLGALQVAVHMLDGVMSVSFETSNSEATRMLSHSLTQLKHVLESQGVSVDKLHVQQAPRNEQSSSNSNDPDQPHNQRHGAHDDNLARQEQQRKEMLRRMWRRLALGNDPLDLVA